MRNKKLTLLTAAAVSLAANFAFAQEQPPKVGAVEAGRAADSKLEATDAEVKKIDLDAKKITLKHGEIKNLEMPAMTMVFQVADAKLLEKIKAGDKVKFVAEQQKGKLLVTRIEVAN